jgi:hypothetical protein
VPTLGVEVLGAVVRDAWRQCRQRPLAVAIGAALVAGSPGFPPHLDGPSQELHGWANIAFALIIPAGVVLSVLVPLFAVAWLGGARLPDQSGGGVVVAARAAWAALRPGFEALLLTCVFILPAQFVVLVGGGVLGYDFMVDAPVQTPAVLRQELLFRLLVAWPLVAAGLAVLALVLPRIVLDGEREVARAVNLSGRVARRAIPVCALIGLLEAGGVVIRAGSSTTVELSVAGIAGLGSLFGLAMANALLWHTRPWQQTDEAPAPEGPLVDG